jgi:hypothetical protein
MVDPSIREQMRKTTMFARIKAVALSAALGMGMLAAVPAQADASSITFSFGSGQGTIGVQYNDGRHWDRGGYRHRGPSYRGRGECHAQEAVRKASRMGVRGARVVRHTHRTVHVAGRARGYGPVQVVFANQHRCPVIS